LYKPPSRRTCKIRHQDFFPTICSMRENKEVHYNKLRTRVTFQVSSTKNPLFGGFTSSGVHKQPVWCEVLAPAFLYSQGSQVQRQYWKWTTLRSKSTTIKGLLYTPDPDNREKGTLSDGPRLSRISSTVLLCCWGCSHSKI
jgi:hypothetical protein